MILQTHDQLETYVYAITLIGIGIGGWTAYLQAQKNRLDERIDEIKTTTTTQWAKIDELRTKSENFVSRDRHDQSIKDIYNAIEKAVEQATKPLIDALDRLADKVDKLMLK